MCGSAQKKIVRTTRTQGRPVDLRDRVDAFSITPNVSLDSGTPAAPRAPVPPEEVIRNILRKSSVNLSGIENFDFQTCVLDLKTCRISSANEVKKRTFFLSLRKILVKWLF